MSCWVKYNRKNKVKKNNKDIAFLLNIFFKIQINIIPTCTKLLLWSLLHFNLLLCFSEVKKSYLPLHIMYLLSVFHEINDIGPLVQYTCHRMPRTENKRLQTCN